MELDALDGDFKFTLGGGLLRLTLSLGGGGGAGGEDEDSVCGEMLLLVGFVGAAVLLIFVLGGAGSEFTPGGGGMTRLGPFIGRYAVPSASAEG